MARKTIKINPIRGERLKILLSERNMDQKELAEKIGYSKEHISYVINGRRNLTADAAELIIKFCPNVRFEWLMGYDDFKTDNDFKLSPLKKALFETCDKRIVFSALLKCLGYDRCVLDHSDYADLSFLDIRNMDADSLIESLMAMGEQIDKIEYNILKSGNVVGRCTAIEYEALVNEIFEFIEFKIKKICKRNIEDG